MPTETTWWGIPPRRLPQPPLRKEHASRRIPEGKVQGGRGHPSQDGAWILFPLSGTRKRGHRAVPTNTADSRAPPPRWAGHPPNKSASRFCQTPGLAFGRHVVKPCHHRRASPQERARRGSMPSPLLGA